MFTVEDHGYCYGTRRKDHGFSLVELLVVIAILGTMLAMASVGLDLVQKARVTSTTREIVSDIQQVRANSMIQGSSVAMPNLRGFGIRFDSPTSFVMFKFNDADGDYVYEGVGDEADTQTKTMPSSVNIQISNNPDYKILIYDRFGTPTRCNAAGDPMPATPGSPLLTLLVSNPESDEKKCIKVWMNNLREGVWNAGTSECKER